jgi:hypothetical protein
MDPIANPDLLIQQLKALIANPEVFSTQGTEIVQLSRQAAVALEGPFETFQRLAYSVCFTVLGSCIDLSIIGPSPRVSSRRTGTQHIPNPSREQG